MSKLLIPAIILIVVTAAGASAQDIREVLRKAEADHAAARDEAERAFERVLADRLRLTTVVDSLETYQAALEAELRELTQQQAAAEASRDRLQERWSREELDFRELSGNVRVAARDLESLLRSSPLTATTPGRLDPVMAVLREGYFPDLDDISILAATALDEFVRSGRVTIEQDDYTGSDGHDTRGDIVHFGRFTTVYRTDHELGFLLWNPDGQRLVAMSEPLESGVRKQMASYLDGKSNQVPIDLSGGPALYRIVRKPTLLHQLRQGGPIVYPLIALAVVSLLVAFWKFFHLHRVHANTSRLMVPINEEVSRGNWDRCRDLVNEDICRHSPVARVVRAGLDVRHESREIQESVLQEAMLHELPLLQRGLAMLAVFGAVAPLLGLLGTVTGMIETFRIITLHGTGDPKLMSGGISEALVTTEFGLAIAIPVILMHTWFKRRVDHVIGDMEEQAMHMVNIIDQGQEGEDRG